MAMQFDELLAHAHAQVEGLQANTALWNVRSVLEAEYAQAVCYEIVLGPESTWEKFLEVQIPRLTEHLRAKGLPLFGAPNVVLSIWQGSTMYMFSCAEFFDAVRTIERVSMEDLEKRVHDAREALGLSPTKRKSTGLLLGPPLPAKPDPSTDN